MEANVVEKSVGADDDLEKLEEAYITAYRLSVYSYEDMLAESKDIVITKTKTSSDVLVDIGGINDARMGTISFTDVCKTCSAHNCPGHKGIIKFGPGNAICNPLFIKTIVKILNCVCHHCSRVLFCKEIDKHIMTGELVNILKRSPEHRLTELEKYLHKKTTCDCDYSKTKHVSKCPPSVKLKSTEISEEGAIQYVVDGNKQTMHTSKIMNILKNITAEDQKYLGFIGDTRPFDLIMQGILVIPPQARPPTTDKNGNVIQNPLTTLYLDVLKAVNKEQKEQPGKIYVAVKSLILKNDNNRKGGQEIKTTSELQQGKKGLFRQAMMGKRSDFCCRTVAGPGEHLAFGQEVLPLEWSYILTKPVKVTNFNIKFLTNLLELKRINYISGKNGVRRSIDYNKPLEQLVIGQQVEVQLKNKDRIYLNRQPSLTKGSMMGFEIVFEEGLVIKSHLSITTSLNLDHDGDELNAWIPQDYEVESELEFIVNAKNCLISTASGKANMGLVMNSVTASHLLALPASEISETLYEDLLMTLTNKEGLPTLTQRLNQFGFDLYRTDNEGVKHFTGRAALSALFPPNFTYQHKGVEIANGILISGVLTKSHVGPTSRSIVQDLVKHYGINRASDFLTDAPHLLNWYIANRGFSVGINDCANVVTDSKSEQVNLLYNKNTQILNDLYQQLLTLIFSHKSYQDLPTITKNVIDIIDSSTKLAYDKTYNQSIHNAKMQLFEINEFTNKIGKKKCDPSLLSDVATNFKILSGKKQTFINSINTIFDEFNKQIKRLNDKVVSDPFLIQLKSFAHRIQSAYLMAGQNNVIDTNFNVTVASIDDLMQHIISRIFTQLYNIKNNRIVKRGSDISHVLNDLDKILRRLAFEGVPNYALYDQLYITLKQLKVDNTEKTTEDIDLFLANVPKKYKSYKNKNIIEEDEDIHQLNQTLLSTIDDYEQMTDHFMNTMFNINRQLSNCQLSNENIKIKNFAILGQYNEMLLIILKLVYNFFVKNRTGSYNKNYVVKKEELAKIMLDIEALGSKKGLPPKEAEFKELKLMEKLNIAGTIGAKLAHGVAKSNAIIAQTETGAGTKGSTANVGQIMGAIGQQYMSGKRLWNDHSRLSSHFDEDDESPAARGFIESSFLEGLTPTEMFFIQAAGRESVIETYMNTPTIGKLQRFMERALENVIIAYDGSVRNNVGFLYSPSYNMGFGIDKMLSVGTADKPLLTNFIDLNLVIDKNNQEQGWYSKSKIKNTELKIKTTLSLDEQLNIALKNRKSFKNISIESKYQNAEQKLTLFEKARIIGIRAQMLNENDVPRVDVGELVDALDIAKLEYEQGKLAEEPALFIIRTLPDGSTIKIYPTIDNII